VTMPDLVPVVNCPICGSSSYKMVSDCVKTINEKSKLAIELRECSECAHWWNTPLPSQSDLITLYREASPFVVSDNWGQEIQKKKPILFFDELILSYNYPSSFKHYLEIGCGAGHMFKLMKNKLDVCYGIEPGDWCDVENIVDDISKLPGDITFEVFVLQDVIEHLVDPVSTLFQYSKRASDEAILFVSFPNKDTLIAKRKKHKWEMIRPFGHLHYFSKTSLTLLLKSSGWEVTKMIKGPNQFPLTHWKTYNFPRTLKKWYQNDQWYVIGERK
jgi:hypothetical protein